MGIVPPAWHPPGISLFKVVKLEYNGGDGKDATLKIVVIMAGDELPTYLATPANVVVAVAVNDTHVSNL
ncbi:hypothetical protein L2E82_40106 [Cichorium intybus]|uniref:Uncharacterized protein n=1 Tax=Cichorium intybus TaxID=13427 RepID=A0ACB9ALT8_CICIN|nr:hypothetical protein L2E82_40106 [Cichorium intybus]